MSDPKIITAAQLRAAFEILGLPLDETISLDIGNPRDSDEFYPKPRGAYWRARLTESADNKERGLGYRVSYVPIFLHPPCDHCGKNECRGFCDEGGQ